jgi:hypothetical protein
VVRAVIDDDITAVKDRFRMPSEVRSCHTSEGAGYLVERHAPLADH